MSFSATITDTGNALLRAMAAAVRNGDGLQARVGIFDGAGVGEDGTPVATYATANEYGTSRIPARPFMRPTLDARRAEIIARLEAAMARATGSTTGPQVLRQALTAIAVNTAGEVKKTIRDFTTPPNAPATIERKRRRHEHLRVVDRATGQRVRGNGATLRRAIASGRAVETGNPLVDTDTMMGAVAWQLWHQGEKQTEGKPE